MQRLWNSIDEIFTSLNNAGCNYIVMRNFECFEAGNVFVDGHDDIDLLCDDIKTVKKILDVRKRFIFPTVNSYYINYNCLTVYVDIRYVGDGYYDKNWQKEMLNKKCLFNHNIYIPDFENYFYSLIYHAIYQKRFLSKEYLNKLRIMAHKLGLSCTTEQALLQELKKYMLKNKYSATITKDPAIILNFYDLQNNEITKKGSWIFKRKILDFLKRFRKIGDKYV